MTTPLSNGGQAGTERHRRRGLEAIAAAVDHGSPLTASAIARAASVDRTFLYRHRDLLETLHTAASRPATAPGAGPAVINTSLQADLANARGARLAARVQQLEKHLSQHLGNQAWRESGLGGPRGHGGTPANDHPARTTRRRPDRGPGGARGRAGGSPGSQPPVDQGPEPTQVIAPGWRPRTGDSLHPLRPSGGPLPYAAQHPHLGIG